MFYAWLSIVLLVSSICYCGFHNSYIVLITVIYIAQAKAYKMCFMGLFDFERLFLWLYPSLFHSSQIKSQ